MVPLPGHPPRGPTGTASRYPQDTVSYLVSTIGYPLLAQGPPLLLLQVLRTLTAGLYHTMVCPSPGSTYSTYATYVIQAPS